MKRYFILFFSIFLLSCASEKQQSFITLCPEVFFSKDHRIYITTEENSLLLNNISYTAEINNYDFTKGCLMLNNKIEATITLLFVVKPKKAKKANIILPYYIAKLDNNNNILDIQYYKVTGVLNKNVDESSYIETEIRDIKNISAGFENRLLIGFMVNQKKLKILN